MSETQETETRSGMPGRMLRRAREAKNLTVAAIATQMNLDLRTIEALERDDHASLPAPIFVRGYLRGYARLVDLREAEVLEAYQAQAPREPEPRAVGMSSAPLRPAFRAPVLPWRGLLLTAAALGLAAVGFLYAPQWLRQFTAPVPEAGVAAPETSPGASLDLPAAEPATTSAEPSTPAAETAPPPVGPAGTPAETADGSGAVQLALPPPEPSVARDTPPASASAPEPVGTEESDFGSPQSAAPATGEPVADTPAATEPAAAPAADTAAAPDTDAAETAAPATPAASAAPAAAPAPGEVRMAFTFNGESWVEVRDGGGNKLLFDLMRKGDTREISGKAPISVLVGNADSVELRVNGERFDLAPHSRDDVARLRIEAGR